MKKISVVGLGARNSFIKGAKYLSQAIGSTLGPFGSNAYLEHGHKITNDGFSISAELANTLEDEFERQGALALHNASSKTNDEVGDATTSSEVLAQAIIEEAVKLLPNDGKLVSKKKPSEVSKMIETSKLNVIDKLKEAVIPIETEEQVIASAKVSVEDEELANLIGSTQFEIGKNGFIVAEETNEPISSIQVVKGIRIDNGFGAPIMITNPADQSLVVTETPILLTNYTIQAEDLIKLKDKVISPLLLQKKTLLTIIARAFSADAIKLCQESFGKGFAIFPINAPYVNQGDIMRDLAAITGSTYYDTEEKDLNDIEIKDIGFATKVLARRFDAIITGVENNPLIADSIQTRIRQLEEKLNGTAVSDFEKKGLEARIAQFQGGFAILKVGGETSFERQYKLDKAQDAVNSVRLAFQEGTVKGGGVAFKEISETLNDDDILKKPLNSIYNQIMSSAPEGFVIEDWVRDPFLTLVAALKNACSVATQFASINAIVTTKDKKEKEDQE